MIRYTAQSQSLLLQTLGALITLLFYCNYSADTLSGVREGGREGEAC